MKNGDILTRRQGPSSSFLNFSSSGLPKVNSPPGTAIILMDADVPGTVSVKSSKESTTAAAEYFSPDCGGAFFNAVWL